MGKLFKVLFCAVVVDFFFFSSRFFFTGRLNSKEILALIGIFLLVFDWIKGKKVFLSVEFIGLLIGSSLVSFAAFFSVMFHNTTETAYTTYFLSMTVWLSAAYTAVRCIHWIHKSVSVEIMCKYIVFIAMFQGIIAVAADMNASIDSFVTTVVPSVVGTSSVDRLHGLGDTTILDVGGIRFAIAEVLCAFVISNIIRRKESKLMSLYILVFAIICVTGNMVARTTIVGTVLGLVYFLFHLLPRRSVFSNIQIKALSCVVIETIIVFAIVSSIYQTNDKFHSRTRFAFEGFFSLVETGHWHTASNTVLLSMYRWPDNTETWLIGDGYFGNPYWDMNYYGAFYEGFYKDTDVGYLRFIYFFGLLGLCIFSGFILYAGSVCMRKFPNNKLLMLMMTSMTFVIWLKVATDCFFILAMFICLGYTRDIIATRDETDNQLGPGQDEEDLQNV